MEKKIFNDTKHAFALKSDKELNKSIFIFKMMSHSWLVNIGTKLTNFCLKLKLPVTGLIKSTIFEQFCSGETKEESLHVVKKIHTMNVYTVFDFASEVREKGEAAFDKDVENQIIIADFAANHKEIPYVVVKPSAIGNFDVWTKVNDGESLNAEEQQTWDNIEERLDTICKKVYDLNLRLLVDAEESWIQTAADNLVEKMMVKYNKKRAVVYNTAQCYRWDRLQYIKDIHKRAVEQGFKVGMKIVRGAYMEKENARALQMGYPTPICEDKEATDVNYNAVLHYCMQNLEDIAVYIGTHNEVSSYMAMQFIDEMGYAKDDDRIWFSQLYGMSDNITFNLGLNGYNSAKFIPFGKVEEVVPYLIRRAQENTSVKGQTGRELALLQEEKNRREGTYVKRVE